MNVRLLLAPVIAVAVAACGVAPTPQPTLMPSSTPTATPAPTSPPPPVPSASASPLPSGSPATVAASTFKFPDSLNVTSFATPLTADDGHFYYPGADGASVIAGDWVSGATRTVVSLAVGHRIDGLAVSGGWLGYVDGWKDGPPGKQGTPCMTNSTKPLNWRIVAVNLTTGKAVVVDSGASRRTTPYPGNEICSGPTAPLLAVSGNLVGYDREDATATQPLRERIIVRSLPTGSFGWQTETAGAVAGITLAGTSGSGQLLAYLEQHATGSARLILSSPGRPIFRDGEVAVGVESVVLSRDANGFDRLTWVALDDQGGRTIWSAIGAANPVRIDTGLHRGWTALTADASRIVWGQVATDTDQPAPITVWDIGSGQITTIPTTIDVMRVWLSPGGWLAWAGEGLDGAGHKIERGYAVSPASQTHASDAATARSLVARYEAASAAGDDATAWSLLAAWSQNQFPSLQSFADSRRVAFAGAAAAYVTGEPRTDDPTIPGWLVKGAPGVSDPGRVFSVEVTHPNASPAALRREVFFVALDMSGTWKIWIVN
jgi:hypothetical protein